MADDTEKPPLRDPEPHEVGEWIAKWVRQDQGAEKVEDLEMRFVVRMLQSRLNTSSPFQDRCFSLGEGATIVGIIPMQRRIYDEKGDEQWIKNYGVTLSHAVEPLEVGTRPDAEAYERDETDPNRVFIVVPDLEWACRIVNSFFNDGKEHFTIEKLRGIEAHRATPEEPPADPDLSLPDDQQ